MPKVNVNRPGWKDITGVKALALHHEADWFESWDHTSPIRCDSQKKTNRMKITTGKIKKRKNNPSFHFFLASHALHSITHCFLMGFSHFKHITCSFFLVAKVIPSQFLMGKECFISWMYHEWNKFVLGHSLTAKTNSFSSCPSPFLSFTAKVLENTMFLSLPFSFVMRA